ncbi:hypothetical protein [Gluconobacter cerinus]|uniref:hypothetical protein n=1 Tax=Gluconobacter cerinus TaxID=38307 RepID=UPI003AB1E979
MTEIDPFFSNLEDSEWYACIGRQGDELNYIDGYIEAAIELLRVVIDGKQYGKRDTLVLPILYTTRHGVELSLKYIIDILHKNSLIKESIQKNHDIKYTFTIIENKNIGDEKIRHILNELRPYIMSLHKIDDDGQQFRYANTREGELSLASKENCNLELVRKSVLNIHELLNSLRNRISDYTDECHTQTFTKKCSRLDIKHIALMLPYEKTWSQSTQFIESKEKIMERFDLSRRNFSEIINLIKKNREFAGYIGIEWDFLYISENDLIISFNKWYDAHNRSYVPTTICFSDKKSISDAVNAYSIADKNYEELASKLTHEQCCDMESLYYIGRENVFCEQYEDEVKKVLKHRISSSKIEIVRSVVGKLNFIESIINALKIIGKTKFSDELHHLSNEKKLS